VTSDSRVKITDFGIARMTSSAVQTQNGMVLGSPKYMSPEQVLGKPIDQRSDIFSLGVMLFEMLTETAPFVGDTLHEMMFQTININPPAPSSIDNQLPAGLDLIVAKALKKEPNDRYQSAREFASDLSSCGDSLHN
jgi:serine/threonine-protein kinase